MEPKNNPFHPCNICKKNFFDAEKLKTHWLNTHIVAIDYFATTNVYGGGIGTRTRKRENGKYKCIACSSKYTTTKGFMNHVVTAHKRRATPYTAEDVEKERLKIKEEFEAAKNLELNKKSKARSKQSLAWRKRAKIATELAASGAMTATPTTAIPKASAETPITLNETAETTETTSATALEATATAAPAELTTRPNVTTESSEEAAVATERTVAVTTVTEPLDYNASFLKAVNAENVQLSLQKKVLLMCQRRDLKPVIVTSKDGKQHYLLATRETVDEILTNQPSVWTVPE